MLPLLAARPARAEPLVPDPPPEEQPWYDAFDFEVFVDAYASVNANLPKPQTGKNRFRAYDTNNGFSLAWVGGDIRYPAAPVGGTVSLRLGPAAERLAETCLSEGGQCDGDVPGLSTVAQAYGSWSPARWVTLDVGKFDTVVGIEVAKSQANLNYTRGIVYWLAQPKYHTGVRGTFQLTPGLELAALVVNGWNNTIDNNVGKTFGVEARVAPSPKLRAQLGALSGPEQDDSASLDCAAETSYNARTGRCEEAIGAPAASYMVDRGGANAFDAWRHLIDLAVEYHPLETLTLVLNADYGTEGLRTREDDGTVILSPSPYAAGMLGARYGVGSWFAVAGRGEVLYDWEGHPALTQIRRLALVTGTLTLEAMPTSNLQIRLEGRGDFAVDAQGPERLFPKAARQSEEHQLTTTLGMVVMTN